MPIQVEAIESEVRVDCHNCGQTAAVRIDDGTTIGLRLCVQCGTDVFCQLGKIINLHIQSQLEKIRRGNGDS